MRFAPFCIVGGRSVLLSVSDSRQGRMKGVDQRCSHDVTVATLFVVAVVVSATLAVVIACFSVVVAAVFFAEVPGTALKTFLVWICAHRQQVADGELVVDAAGNDEQRGACCRGRVDQRGGCWGCLWRRRCMRWRWSQWMKAGRRGWRMNDSCWYLC